MTSKALFDEKCEQSRRGEDHDEKTEDDHRHHGRINGDSGGVVPAGSAVIAVTTVRAFNVS